MYILLVCAALYLVVMGFIRKRPGYFLGAFLSIYLGAYLIPLITSEYISFSIPNPFEYARITSIDYKATLHDSEEEGNFVDVVETLDFDIRSFSKDKLCVELWRGMSEDRADGLTTKYKVKSVKQIMPDGTKVEYDKALRVYTTDEDYTSSELGPKKWVHSGGPYNPKINNYECVLIYPEPVYRDHLKFEIEYEIYNITFRYKDCSELYMQIYNGDETKYLKSFNAEILIPNDLMPADDNYYARAYGTNTTIIDYQVDKEKNPGYCTFYFNLSGKTLSFKPYNKFIEFLIVSYNKDYHIFSEHAEKNRYTNDNALRDLKNERNDYESLRYFSILKIIVFFICVFIGVLTLISTIKLIRKHAKEKIPIEETNLDYDYYATIPERLDLHFVSALFHCKDKKQDNIIEHSFPANLLSLMNKGVISIENNIIKIEKNYVQDNNPTLQNELDLELTPSENKVYFLIKRHTINNQVPWNTLLTRIKNDYDATCNFEFSLQSFVKEYGYINGYFSSPSYNEGQQAMVERGTTKIITGIEFLIALNTFSYFTYLDFAYGGYTLLGLVFIICGIYLLIRSKNSTLLTAKGELEYKRWHAYYKYLSKENLYHETDQEGYENFEECLLYAIALGLPVKKIKKLKVKFPKLNSLSQDIERRILRHRCIYFRSYRHRVYRSTRSASRAHFASIYSGSSYSRGGRGGGGGF